MHIRFEESFDEDIKRIKDKKLLNRLYETIIQVEKSQSAHQIRNIRKIKDAYFRIRIGDYRIGLEIKGGLVTFVRFLHRKDIYRYFP